MKTLPQMTDAERRNVLAKCNRVISAMDELLTEGDVDEDQFKFFCTNATNATVLRAAITSWRQVYGKD